MRLGPRWIGSSMVIQLAKERLRMNDSIAGRRSHEGAGP